MLFNDKDHAINDLNALVDACSSAQCEIRLNSLMWGDKAIETIHDGIWDNNDSVDEISELGLVTSDEPELAKEASPVVLSDDHGRTIHLEGHELCFAGYGHEDFTLIVGTKKTLDNGTVVELLDNGTLKYSFSDSSKIKTAAVPRGAKPDKFWCSNCAANKSCKQHEV